MKSPVNKIVCLRNAAIQVAYFCVCGRERGRSGQFKLAKVWVQPVGDSLSTICSAAGGTCMLLWYCGHLAAPHYSPVEAEWIWKSEEVINLHIGDMLAG